MTAVGVAVGQSGTGLRAEYYLWGGSSPPTRQDAFRDLFTTRVAPQIYCYSNSGFQAVHPDGLKPDFKIPPPDGLRADYFAVRWSGEIEALKSETYTFVTGSDDGVRVWLNGKLIIDDWTQWNIPLQSFADKGVDLTNANTIALGFGDKANLQPGGSGVVYSDDI